MKEILKQGQINDFQYELSSYKFNNLQKIIRDDIVFALGISVENSNIEIYLDNAKNKKEVIQKLDVFISRLNKVKAEII